MINKKGIVLFIFCLVGLFSCKKEIPVVKKDDFLSKIVELKEFKALEKRVDSLKNAGIQAQIDVKLMKESIFSEDSAKNISVAFVEEYFGFAGKTELIIKYDRDQKKIISVKNSIE